MIKVGIVGFGFMGRMHYRCWNEFAGAKVVAVCDADPDIVSKTGSAGGNIDGAAGKIDLSDFELFSDFDRMLAEGNLDVVSVTLPSHLHKAFTIKALNAGVHVFCEKPMALSVEQCSEMIAAAEQSGKLLQIGHCIRFWPEYAKTKEIIDSGQYGKVVAATFQRLGAPPSWGDNWFANDELSGGMAMDLHIHDSDFVQYLFGMPASVCSAAAGNADGAMSCIASRYEYDDGKLVTAEGSWAMSPSFGFEMSFNIVMEKATILFDCTRDPSFKVCPFDGEVSTPEVAAGDGYSRELEHFAGLVNGKKMPEVITLEQSLNSIQLVLAEIESAKTGQRVTI